VLACVHTRASTTDGAAASPVIIVSVILACSTTGVLRAGD
jgi:hypothetical protein